MNKQSVLKLTPLLVLVYFTISNPDESFRVLVEKIARYSVESILPSEVSSKMRDVYESFSNPQTGPETKATPTSETRKQSLPTTKTSKSAVVGNRKYDSFSEVKKILLNDVYKDNRKTIYCNATFTANSKIQLPTGFTTPSQSGRAKRLEWEHVVPAENFGRAFKEWRNGDSQCIDSRGNAFKGRNCTEKVNKEFRYMLCDMYNLYPAIGAVNALRSNYDFNELPLNKATFGSCQMKISDKKVEPPKEVRGVIARTYKYMAATYSNFNLGSPQKRLMDKWDCEYPVTKWECNRAKRIERIQGNENSIVKPQCIQKNLW